MTRLLRVSCSVSELDQENIQMAVNVLQKNQPVAIPTETVYGLAANALSDTAVSSIFKVKGRPSDNPLIVHISDLAMLRALYPNDPTILNPYHECIKAFWPGPLTILLPKPHCIPDSVTAGQPTMAVRFPAHPVARAIIHQCGFPLAAPSANTSGRPSPTLAEHVLSDLNGKIELIIDGGLCDSGVESTVINALVSPPIILRPGGLTFESLKRIFPDLIVYQRDIVDKVMEERPATPGMKYRHYTPDAKVILVPGSQDALEWESQLQRWISQYSSPNDKIGVMVYTPIHLNVASYQITDASMKGIAKEIFKGLRYLESQGVTIIFVEGVPETEEGLAIMNRLKKAASIVI
jgi:L-threonylcarbamoyladenylate synthase